MKSGIAARKRLGQHFLRNRKLADGIVGALGVDACDVVLEIGPGEGIVTEALLDTPAGRVIAVEIDERCCVHLENRFGRDERFELIRGDILDTEFCEWIEPSRKLRVIGNLPYYITSPILFHLFENRNCIRNAVVTVQKEVGDRLVSAPGSKVYGIPSVLFQAVSRVERVLRIPRENFRPVPGVDSAVMRLTFCADLPYEIGDVAFFQKVVRTAFGQRRKMLKNTLKSLVEDAEALRALPVNLNERPENVSVAGFVELSQALLNR